MMSGMDHPQVGITMHMAVNWKWDISFIFESWTVTNDQPFKLFLVILASIIISFLSVALPALKTKIVSRVFKSKRDSSLLVSQNDMDQQQQNQNQKESKQILFTWCYILIYSFMHILTMMIIMTYNGYIIIFTLVGLTLAYTILGMQSDKDKNIPVNCCA